MERWILQDFLPIARIVIEGLGGGGGGGGVMDLTRLFTYREDCDKRLGRGGGGGGGWGGVMDLTRLFAYREDCDRRLGRGEGA